MVPTGGQANEAEANGRKGLMIHGGDRDGAGRLRRTHGCVRVGNDDMARIINAFDSVSDAPRCEVVKVTVIVSPIGGLDGGHDAGDPPPNIVDIINGNYRDPKPPYTPVDDGRDDERRDPRDDRDWWENAPEPIERDEDREHARDDDGDRAPGGGDDRGRDDDRGDDDRGGDDGGLPSPR